MNIKNKKKWVIGIIIFLLITNLSALGTIIYLSINDRSLSSTSFDKNISEQKTGNSIEERGFGKYIKERLNFSQQQYDHFHEIMRKTRENQHQIISQMQSLRRTMMNELSKEQPDSMLLDEYAKQIGHLHYQLKQETIRHFYQMKEICTSEQEERLNEMIRHMPNGMPHQGNGPPHRKRPGRYERMEDRERHFMNNKEQK